MPAELRAEIALGVSETKAGQLANGRTFCEQRSLMSDLRTANWRLLFAGVRHTRKPASRGRVRHSGAQLGNIVLFLPEPKCTRHLPVDTDQLVARRYASTEPVVREDACSDRHTPKQIFRRGDVVLVSTVGEVGPLPRRMIRPEPIFTDWVEKIVRITARSGHLSKCAGNEADAIVHVEQVGQGARGRDQRGVLLEPDEPAPAEERRGDAELAGARTNVDYGLKSRAVEPLGRPLRDCQRSPVLWRNEPQRLGQKAIK